MFPIIVFLLGFFALIHGASLLPQDVFQAVGLIVLGVAVMVVGLTTARPATRRSHSSHSAAVSRSPAKRGS